MNCTDGHRAGRVHSPSIISIRQLRSITVADSTITAAEPIGVFTRDQVEILSTRRGEPEWLREQRIRAQEVWATTPMPTPAGGVALHPDPRHAEAGGLRLAEEAKPVTEMDALPAEVRARFRKRANPQAAWCRSTPRSRTAS
jgi:hypothetical protein